MDKKTSLLTLIALGLFSLFFLPVTQDFYDTNKQAVLVLVAIIVLTFWGCFLLFGKKFPHIHISSLTIAFGALTVASLVSLLAASTNRVEAIVNPLGLATYIAMTILFLTAGSFSITEKRHLRWFLYSSTAILGLLAIYQFFGMGTIMFKSVQFLQNPLWTPTGATTTTLAVFTIVLSLIVPHIITTIKKPHKEDTIAVLILFGLVIVLGECLTLWQFIPKITTSVLPLPAAWAIVVNIYKNIKFALVGVGAENFLSAYTMGKPAALSMRFGTSSNFFLHIATVYGLVGLVASLVFARLFFVGKKMSASFFSKMVCFLAILFVPPTITLLIVVACALFLFDEPTASQAQPTTTKWIRIGLAIVLLATSGIGFYFFSRAYAAELYYFDALKAVEKNEGTNAYTLHIKAIGANPYITRYHINFSKINLVLANNLAGEKKQDTTLVGQLVQQAIQEAKVAVTLNTQSILAWENLAVVYQTLMPVAHGADSWAQAAYEKSILLDPTNTTLLLNLGAVLVQEQKYDEAIAVFKRVIALAPSLPNSYYNLANAYRRKGDTASAAEILMKAMGLVQPGSADELKLKTELDALRNL